MEHKEQDYMRYTIWVLLLFLIVFQGCETEEQKERRLRKTTREQGEKVEQEQEGIEETIPEDALFKSYTFDVNKESYTIDLPISESLISYFGSQPKVYRYEGRQLPSDWEKDYYNMFLTNEKDERLIKQIIRRIKDLKPSMTEAELVEFLIAFVQGGLAYDWDSFYSVADQLNYPYETIFKEKGVCSDKSLVLSKLLAFVGYDIALFAFPKANHMAIGIRVPAEFGSFKTNYAFIETTNYTNIGIIPDNYIGNITLEADPTVVNVKTSGRKIFEGIRKYKAKEEALLKKYGKPYLSASAQEKKLLENMHKLSEQIEALKEKLKELGCKGIVSTRKAQNCNEINEELNLLINDYNEKVQKYNALNETQQS